jgi:hypothetical protein
MAFEKEWRANAGTGFLRFAFPVCGKCQNSPGPFFYVSLSLVAREIITKLQSFARKKLRRPFENAVTKD